jgi:PAS domain S-box-containing protein
MIDPLELGIGRLFYAIRDAVVVGDVHADRIVLWNPAATELFGYTAEEAVGRPISILVPERFRDRHAAGIGAYRERGTGPIVEGGPTELTACHRDGREIPIELTLGRIPEVEGGRRYVLAVIRDRTDAHAAEAQRTALEREKTQRRLSTQFFQMAAHEIRTPLTGILGLVQLATRRLERGDPDGARANLDAAMRSAADMAELVDELLDVSRIQSGRLELHHRTVDVVVLVHEVALGHAAGGRPIRVEAPHRAVLEGDERWLRQVLNNLVRNAVKYSPADAPVEVLVQLDPEHVRVRVRDRGLGVPSDQRDELFQPFFRATNVGDIRGTGLGLFISRGIAELHGGSLILESSGPEGSSFLLTLPVSRPPSASPA